MQSRNTAFTLIELLVVITIIVVLLSLLAPALDKAIYRAELLQCSAGNLKSMAGGVTSYAFDNKRYYPDRGLGELKNRDEDPAALPVNPQTVKRYSVDYDIRPLHREIFPINKTLQCPFSPQIELEYYGAEEQDIGLDASLAMFWAWQYKQAGRSFGGMFKYGGRFTYDDLDQNPNQPSRLNRYSVLAGDIDLFWGGGGANATQTSHPDRDPSVLTELKSEGEWFIERASVGRWWGPPRGLLDTNYVFDDGSTFLFDGVTRVNLNWNHPDRDERMARVPINYNVWNNRGANADKMHIPKR